MGSIIVDVDVLINGEFMRMFHNVKLEVDEMNNRKMIKAFEEQHPRLLAKIPMWTNDRGFTFRCAFECQVHWGTWKD